MLLKPFDDEPGDNVMPPDPEAGILACLNEVGLAPEGDLSIETDPDNHIQAVLNKSGATLETASRELGNLMKNADTDAARLGAIKTVLEMHGALKKDDSQVKLPAINITIVGSGNKSLINVLLPT
jgi:hypothetical protein